jgi:hypothetical protein
MNINQEKQLENRIKRLSNPKTTNKSRISSTLILLFLFAGSFSLLAFQYAKNSKPVLSISSDKMNTIYIGIENPMTVAVENIPNEKIKVTSEDVELRPNGHGKFIAIPKKLGEVKILVKTENMTRSITFEAINVPTPLPVIYGEGIEAGINKTVTLEKMRQMKGVKTQLELQEEYDYACKVTDFEMTRVPKGKDRITVMNEGNLFKGAAKKLIEQVEKNDIYYIDKITAKCPGSEKVRFLNGLVFRVK